jgi:serine/threonine protein phosphatase 1
MRNLVIGDVHGSAKALQQVLERSNFDVTKDRLISIGDIADGWGEVSECVDILLDIEKNSNEENKPIFIRGNHDVWVYDWFKHGLTPSLWTTQGGEATITSYVRTEKLEDENHKNFWFNQKDWYIDDKNNLFIHAGWDYITKKVAWPIDLTPLELFELQASMWYGDTVGIGSIAKSCHWDRDIWYGSQSGAVKNGKTGEPTGFRPLKMWNQVFIGHTAIRTNSMLVGAKPEPKQNINLWNVDTGCGWKGCLTIMDVDTHEYWQSDLSKDLYPDEKGR